ncbi:tRNA (adenosine(37)-N6)-dimethylallyltransferase MiaA [Thiomicrorhabdus sp. 6S2-11]|uniref:tRNA dimethylallyltransferase n=1 Tax=Thiomicrorhabdus marina TaxID=2818442 RepID=A0ABS3Q3D6_9GAMM|nr:tRNA (adenosine(37)-N6)-dimethylallyltransferase MiaA [Thiomicrorhabdus marina]MBO1926847.1 tRNA (adenosine(37)-N6)-dimethylallyltransferase MiaA [Thiomicrorhabdus marina]
MEYSELVNKLIAEKKVLAIMGPTASGKSQLSMALAEILPIEIISVDSALIYRDMDIGSAKPSAEEIQSVPHHLIDTIDASESYSASEFVDDVHGLVKEIFARGKLPVLVGGTMMYFNALQQGMNDLPSADAEVRAKLQKQWDESPESLHQRLTEIDPESAQRIHQNDPQRLIRALEVYQVSGKTLTEHRQNPKKALKDFELIKIALIPEDRSRLHKQIEKRFMQMLEQGFLKEVESLIKRGDLEADMTSIRCVGYRQAWDYLLGDYDYETFVHKGIVATRQLAKRQLTWLRKESDLLVIDPYATSLQQRVVESRQLLENAVQE